MKDKKVFYQQEIINNKQYRWLFYNEDLIIEIMGSEEKLTIPKQLAKEIGCFYLNDHFDLIRDIMIDEEGTIKKLKLNSKLKI